MISQYGNTTLDFESSPYCLLFYSCFACSTWFIIWKASCSIWRGLLFMFCLTSRCCIWVSHFYLIGSNLIGCWASSCYQYTYLVALLSIFIMFAWQFVDLRHFIEMRISEQLNRRTWILYCFVSTSQWSWLSAFYYDLPVELSPPSCSKVNEPVFGTPEIRQHCQRLNWSWVLSCTLI